MFLNEYILSYHNVTYLLDKLCNVYSDLIIKQKPIGYTTFKFPINYYTIGKGKKNVILMSATHGCELVTITFLIEFIYTIIIKREKYSKYLEDYTFHIIPILNPEGYIISSSNVIYNIKKMDNYELQKYATQYMNLYNKDDLNSLKGCYNKLYKNLMNTSISFIPYSNLKLNVDTILKQCNLDSKVLPIWSSNGMGIDINANSIHEFSNMKRLKNNNKYGKLRYNDIPVDKPSPHGFPGDYIFDKRCPENIALYNFVNNLYEDNLKLFISYHSTGGEIYGYPDKNYVTDKQYKIIEKGMKNYSEKTKYTIMDENLKYGVMDYYRISLTNTVTLTVELSKSNGNPIGPFSDLASISKEFESNIDAIFYTLDNI